MTDLEDKDLDRVDAYHRGELSAAEEADLRARITSDPAFAEAVLQQERFLRALAPTLAERTDRAAFKADFKQRQAERSKTRVVPAKVQPIRRWMVGVAAAVLLGVIGYFVVQPTQTEDPVLEASAVPYFTPLNRLGGRMGNTPSMEAQLTTAYKAYDTGDYATAAPLLNSPELVAADSLNLLFGAVAELGLGNEAAAIPTLEGLRKTRFYADYQGEIDFYLGLGYLEVGELNKGLKLLESTSLQKGRYGEEATLILPKFEK